MKRELHKIEGIHPSGGYERMVVPGGWIYLFWTRRSSSDISDLKSTTFVPYDNEFDRQEAANDPE